MAAPIIDAAKRCSTLTNLNKKEKLKNKKKSRNVLCFNEEIWPRPTHAIQGEILDKLSECLSKAPNIFKTGDESKVVVRSQLAIGVSEVFKCLEKRTLSGVLVSGEATPAVTVNHVIVLAKEHGCPLLCLDKLSTTIAKVTDSKVTPLAIGFKKMNESMFEDVVHAITSNSSTESVPALSYNTEGNQEGLVSQQSSMQPICFDSEVEADILAELLSILRKEFRGEPYEEKPVKKKAKKKKKHQDIKSNFKTSFSHQFEVGKQDVSKILESGKLQLILVSKEVKPLLATESTNNQRSLMSLAMKKSCPVFCLSGMFETLKKHYGWNVSFFGLKKFSAANDVHQNIFENLVNLIKKDVSKRDFLLDAFRENIPENGKSMDIANDEVQNIESNDTEEDYSYLYVMKKDSKEYRERLENVKQNAKELEKAQSFTTDFISLSGSSEKNPTKETPLITKSKSDQKVRIKSDSEQKCSSNILESFSFDRSGQTSNEKNIESTLFEIDRKPRQSEKSSESISGVKAEADNSQLFTIERTPTMGSEKRTEQTENSNQVLGDLKPPPQLEFLPLDPSLSIGKNKALKRKLKNDPSFISFSYNETNIKTMVANPSKKKKKKK